MVETGYTYVMSDIHGKGKWFNSILNQIQLRDCDKLYILGDIIDRGEDGIQLLEYIKKKGNIELLLGNHELLMLDAMELYQSGGYSLRGVSQAEEWLLWGYNGGLSTFKGLQSYTQSGIDNLIDYIKNLKISKVDLEVNNKKYYIIHGFPEVHIDDASTYNNTVKRYVYKAVWDRLDSVDLSSYNWLPEDTTIIIGHTPTKHLGSEKNRILYDNRYFNIINIDCGCAGNGALGCLRLDDMKEFYAGNWR